MRPFSVSDNYSEGTTKPSPYPDNPANEFNRWKKVGPNAVQITHPDTYTPPSGTSTGTSYTVENNLGALVDLKDSSATSWYLPVRLPNGTGSYTSGADEYRSAVKNCIGRPVSIGQYLPLENGNMVGPTSQGVETHADSLVNKDPLATWDTTSKTVTSTCAPTCAPFSPRIVPVSVFDVDEYQWRETANNWTTPWIPGVGPGTGSGFACPAGGKCIRVVNIIGFFVERMNGNSVRGRVVMYPGEFVTGTPSVTNSESFLQVIQLIR